MFFSWETLQQRAIATQATPQTPPSHRRELPVVLTYLWLKLRGLLIVFDCEYLMRCNRYDSGVKCGPCMTEL